MHPGPPFGGMPPPGWPGPPGPFPGGMQGRPGMYGPPMMGNGPPMMAGGPVAGTGLIAGVKRAAGLMAAVGERQARAASAAEKSTMVSVGKIAPSADNEVVRTLLDACGKVRSWKRAEDPETKALKGFGFCEFEDAEGVLRAVRLLHGLKLDGQELVIKPNSATQRYCEEWEDKRAQARQEAAEKQPKQGEEGELSEAAPKEDPLAAEQAADNKALEIIMGLVSEREEKRLATLPPPPPAPANASEFLRQLETGGALTPAGTSGSRGGTGEDKDRDRDGRTSEPGTRERDRGRDRGDRDRGRSRDRSPGGDRESRDRGRGEDRDGGEYGRQRAIEREYEARLRDVERQERLRGEARERERLRREQNERERLRLCRLDLDESDGEGDLPWWQRKPYRGSRRCQERRRWRVQEEEADALDRQREQRELEAAAKKRKAQAEEDGVSGVAGSRGAGQLEVKTELSEGSQAVHQQHQQLEQPPSPEVDESDPIYRAMVAAARAAPAAAAAGVASVTAAHRAGDRLLHHATHDPHASVKSQHRDIMRSESPPPATTAPPGPAAPPAARPGPLPGKRAALTSLFGDEEDDRATKRVLKPIQYSEEEKRLGEELQREQAREVTPVAAPADPKAALKALMDRIPTTQQDVWEYPVQWQHYTPDVKQRFSQWVAAKVNQLLGGPEPSVVAFILDLVAAHRAPATTCEELLPLLDSDTTSFVIKLYRTIIFETERVAAGL